MFGLLAAKRDYLRQPRHAVWARARNTALPLGLALSLPGGFLMAASDGQLGAVGAWGMVLVMAGSPLLTFGYLGLIAAWAARPRTALKTFMARGGTATLTAYLLQSAILSVMVYGYGLGFYGKIGAATAILIALAVGVFTLAATSLLRKRFARGPFEHALRAFTYRDARTPTPPRP